MQKLITFLLISACTIDSINCQNVSDVYASVSVSIIPSINNVSFPTSIEACKLNISGNVLQDVLGFLDCVLDKLESVLESVLRNNQLPSVDPLLKQILFKATKVRTTGGNILNLTKLSLKQLPLLTNLFGSCQLTRNGNILQDVVNYFSCILNNLDLLGKLIQTLKTNNLPIVDTFQLFVNNSENLPINGSSILKPVLQSFQQSSRKLI